MSYFLSKNAAKEEKISLYYEDHGKGQPIVLIHGWPLSHKMWEHQVPVFVEAGYRVITYDRRGFGQSDRPWTGYDYDTLAQDLNALIQHLDLENLILVGFSMGGGEVARYLGNYGSTKISKAVFMSAVTPFMLQTKENPEGVDEAVFEGMKTNITKDRIGFMREFGKIFVDFENNKDRISEAQVDFNWSIAANASPKGTLDCVDAFGKTDFRADCQQISVPTLVLHGDSDAIVPFEVSGKRAVEMISTATLKIIKNAPHGMGFTHSEEVNQALLSFFKGK